MQWDNAIDPDDNPRQDNHVNDAVQQKICDVSTPKYDT